MKTLQERYRALRIQAARAEVLHDWSRLRIMRSKLRQVKSMARAQGITLDKEIWAAKNQDGGGGNLPSQPEAIPK